MDALSAMKQALEAMQDHGTAYLGHQDEYATAVDCLNFAIKQMEKSESAFIGKVFTYNKSTAHG
jgi:hypothetical protein